MPINYRVSGASQVTPAVLTPQHKYSLDAGVSNFFATRQQKQKNELEEKKAKSKQALDDALYNPGNVNDLEYEKSIQKKAQGVIDYSTKSVVEGKVGSPEYNINIAEKKRETELARGKGLAALSEKTNALQGVNQLPGYYDKTGLATEINEAYHPKTEDGDIDWDNLSPEKGQEIMQDRFKHINTVDMFKSKLEKIPERVKTGEYKFTNFNPNDGTADGQQIKIEGNKALFFTPVMDKDNKKVIKWVPGASDQTADFFLESDEEIDREADYQYEKYIEAETIARAKAGDDRDPREIRLDIEADNGKVQFKRDHVKKNLDFLNRVTPISETKTLATYSKGDGSGNKDEEFKATMYKNQVRKTTGAFGGKNMTVDTDVPEEYRFSGKKMDKPVRINISKAYYENNNRPLSEQELVGDKNVNVSRVFLQAYDQKTNKPLLGKTEDLKKNPNVVYRWAVGGTMDVEEQVGEGEDIKTKVVKRNVIIPYDEMSNDIKAQYGFDLESREDSEISDLELISQIKEQNPNATPEQRLKIYKTLRGK
jgi:hypothetical protein